MRVSLEEMYANLVTIINNRANFIASEVVLAIRPHFIYLKRKGSRPIEATCKVREFDIHVSINMVDGGQMRRRNTIGKKATHI